MQIRGKYFPTSFPFDIRRLCVFHSSSICLFDTNLWCLLINKKLLKTTPLLQVCPKNCIGGQNIQNQPFFHINLPMHVDGGTSYSYHEIFNFQLFFLQQIKNESQTFEKTFLADVCICDERMPLNYYDMNLKCGLLIFSKINFFV